MSDLLRAISTGLMAELGDGMLGQEEAERLGEWLLRCIVSLLAMPGVDVAFERAQVESFLVPVLVDGSRSRPELSGAGAAGSPDIDLSDATASSEHWTNALGLVILVVE